jgi:galactokinase
MDASMYALITQKAENNYFNKPCGLMDQMVIAHGGLCGIDFYDAAQPVVTKVNSNHCFDSVDFCLVQSGGSHADLSADYAEIFEDCKKLSGYFNQSYLSRVQPAVFYEQLPNLNQTFETRILLRGHHFFHENERVLKLIKAMENSDLAEFMVHIVASGRSSATNLQNVWNKHETKQGLALALMMAENALSQDGAYRVHGGGFAGTILLIVPKAKTSLLKMEFNRVFGSNSFIQIRLREVGVVRVF